MNFLKQMEKRLKAAYFRTSVIVLDISRLRQGIMGGVYGVGPLSTFVPEPHINLYRMALVSMCAIATILVVFSFLFFSRFENDLLFENPVQYSYLFY